MVFSFPKGRKKEISGMRRRPAPPQILKKSSKLFVKNFFCSQEMMMHAHHTNSILLPLLKENFKGKDWSRWE
jgi:hypothetical protein